MRRIAAERWVAQEVGGTKKGGMAPLLFCDVVSPAEFSAVGVTDQYPRVIAAR